MSKKLLEQFFKENTVMDETPSAPAIAHFYIALERNPEVNEKLQETFNEAAFEHQPERKEEALTEKREIESAETSEQILRFIRRQTDPVNQHVLVNKAMAFEDEIVPEIVKRLKTSLNDDFIETAVRILGKSEKDIAAELIGYFDDMRNPYAQSMALVILGFKADEAYIPWFIEKYKELKRRYPDESYCEGAYYALYEMESRFYPSGNDKRKKD